MIRCVALGVLCCLIWSGCFTKTQGCLDIQAENFDLNAERKCSSCCTYPSMMLSLSQKWNDRNFSNADTLYDINNQPYKIQDLNYFLSSWSWTDAEDKRYTVDSIESDCNGTGLSFTPDMLVVETRQFIYTMGTIRLAPQIDSIHFTLGLTQDYSCLDPEDPDVPPQLTDQSPLWNHSDSSLYVLRLILQRNLDTDALDTLYLDLHVPFSLDYDLKFVNGFDTQLMLSVDYAQWFSEVDVTELSTYVNSLQMNIPGSIIRTP